MALLHRVRGGGGFGLSAGTVGRALVVMAFLPTVAAGCTEREAEPRNLPDPVLRDSLGLTDADRVHRVVLSVDRGAFTVEPATLRVPRGVWVEFVASEGWPRTVAFDLDSLPGAAAELLRTTGQDASPPLLDPGARFVVSFRGAPAGRYPYRVEGSGRAVRGVVIVEAPEEGG